MKTAISALLIFSLLFHEGISLSNGIPSSACDKIILEQYNVNPTACSSNFIIKSSTSSYTINEPVTITISSTKPDTTFTGIYLLAQDRSSTKIGSWKTTDSLVESASCNGLMHKSKVEKTSIEAVWYPTVNVAEDITIKAIIIENDNMIYVNCYNVIITPRTINHSLFNNGNDSTTDATTTTAANTTETANTTMITTTEAMNTTEAANTTMATTSAAMNTTETVHTTMPTTSAAMTSTSPSAANTTRTPSPTAAVSVNVTWTYNNMTHTTDVLMTIHNLKAQQWTAVGLGSQQAMGEAHVFMCKRLADDTIVINRYINPDGHHHPEHAGSEQGGTFTPIQQEFHNGVVLCQFSLSNFTDGWIEDIKTIDPLSPSKKYYPLFAIGLLNTTTNEPRKHGDDSHTALSDRVQLDQDVSLFYKMGTPDSGSSLRFLRAHGIIMIFTWILIASTGVLISRYFKVSWANSFICGKAAWFASHRFIMSVAAILTILGFFFVLAFLKGAWVAKGSTRQYAHSVTGAIVISLAFFQPFIALFRCEPDSRFRFIFNLVHAFVGFSSFILATTTLFLATYFEIFKDHKGRTMMIIWSIWVALIFISFEIIQSYYRKKAGESNYTNINTSTASLGENAEGPKSSTTSSSTFANTEENSSQTKVKNILLAVHVLVAAIISIVMATDLQS
ncbi:unnamed protein product [Rotaria magnacalcarata]|uniref:Ferric-chelate reductase 1 n=5 Tax=Rotaria magnacalcarata TaxID=392030 RepID=A0A816AV88_9BILA|nr:unnamed protein product [Rotaria magnacalcarata]CAF1924001.1 unnamed protein product [Rotaria magnacalcarata]